MVLLWFCSDVDVLLVFCLEGFEVAVCWVMSCMECYELFDLCMGSEGFL